MTERWTKGAIVRSRMYDMMGQTSITNTVIMNTHRPFMYYPHSRWTQSFSACNNAITLGHTNDVCTAIGELIYYFIVIQVVHSLVPLLHRIQLSGIWRLQQERENMIFTPHIACSSSPFNKYPIDHPKLHSKLCFGSNILTHPSIHRCVRREKSVQVAVYQSKYPTVLIFRWDV